MPSTDLLIPDLANDLELGEQAALHGFGGSCVGGGAEDVARFEVFCRFQFISEEKRRASVMPCIKR